MKGDYFIYTGNAYPHKNLERLIQAFVLINKQSLSFRGQKKLVKLKISSSRGVFTERLEKIVIKNNAQKYVEILGYVPDGEIQRLYKNSLAFVFPTLSEGFGLPPKEAIEAGTLAILSDIPVLKEVYADSVFYFDPYNIRSIADSLEKVLALKDSERKDKIEYAQKFLKKYSWQKMAEETLKIYETVI